MIVIVFLIFILSIGKTVSIQCVNNQRQPVDWYIILKLPDVVDNGKGLSYGYLDSNNQNLQFYPNINDINTSPLLMTIQPYASTQTNQYAQILWNDQPNSTYSTPSTMAHAKGFMIFNNQSGIIMVHTLPKFPQTNATSIILDITTGSTWYGQHYFCISVDTTTIEQYSQMLLIDRPFVYSSQIPQWLQTYVPYTTQLLDNTIRSSYLNQTLIFNSIGGKLFVKFAKSSLLVKNFYYDIVAQQLNSSMVFETWGQGGLEDPNCGKYSVVSNLYVQMSPNISFSYTQDHSKYGISVQSNYVCFGDINRQQTQDKRGGGTVCFVSENVHSLINGIFKERQQCKKRPPFIHILKEYINIIFEIIIKLINKIR